MKPPSERAIMEKDLRFQRTLFGILAFAALGLGLWSDRTRDGLEAQVDRCHEVVPYVQSVELVVEDLAVATDRAAELRAALDITYDQETATELAWQEARIDEKATAALIHSADALDRLEC